MKIIVAMITVLVGLSACHGGFRIGENDRPSTDVATDTLGSAVAQASLGSVSATAE
jgi:hypothetical protein